MGSGEVTRLTGLGKLAVEIAKEVNVQASHAYHTSTLVLRHLWAFVGKELSIFQCKSSPLDVNNRLRREI